MRSRVGSQPAAVAVIGAGISGLVCARTLADAGVGVRVFDKGRGVGGRMSTRRAGRRRFDHGAQYFTLQERRFATAVRHWLETGVAAKWEGRIVVLENGESHSTQNQIERFVAVPGMNAICCDLARMLDVSLATHIAQVRREDRCWLLLDVSGRQLGTFDALVVSAPAPQTASLLSGVAPLLAGRAQTAEIAPCWAALVAFDAALGLGFDGAFVYGSPLSWVARNNSKPGRPAGEAWVLHGSQEWSTLRAETDRSQVADQLMEAFRIAVGGLSLQPAYLAAHRWRYALPTEPLPEDCLMDHELNVAACGDWCGGPRLEGAYLSGLAAAHRLLEGA